MRPVWIILTCALGFASANTHNLKSHLKGETTSKIDSHSDHTHGHRVKKSPQAYLQGIPYQQYPGVQQQYPGVQQQYPGVQQQYTSAAGPQVPQVHYFGAGSSPNAQFMNQNSPALRSQYPHIHQVNAPAPGSLPAFYSQQPMVARSSLVQTPESPQYVQISEPLWKQNAPGPQIVQGSVTPNMHGFPSEIQPIENLRQLQYEPMHNYSPAGYSPIQTTGVLGSGQIITQQENRYPSTYQGNNQLQYNPYAQQGSLVVPQNSGALATSRAGLLK